MSHTTPLNVCQAGLLLVVMVSIFLGMIPQLTLAAGFQDGFNAVSDIASSNNAVNGDIGEVITKALNVVLSLIGVIALAAVIYGGFLYVTALGDEKKAAHAKRVLMYAVIGLIVIGLSAVIVNFVIKIFISE